MLRILLATILILALPIAAASSLTRATPLVSNDCPVTRPGSLRPPPESDPFDDEASIHYENGIWVTVPLDGILELPPQHEITFGPLAGWRSESVTWLRDEGVEGFVIVTGERLDEKSTQSPQTPLSPQRQYVRTGFVQTGIAFPSEGCWKVVGNFGEHEITWVMDVRFVVELTATPGP